MIKKYNEVELYKLLHAQANLVKQTKHEVLDKLFKTGVAGPDDINIFSLLGILLDLQNLAVEFLVPNEDKNKMVKFDDLLAFILKNDSKMAITNKKFMGTIKSPFINWILFGTEAFESNFVDFIDYLQNDLHISLVLPQAKVLPSNVGSDSGSSSSFTPAIDLQKEKELKKPADIEMSY